MKEIDDEGSDTTKMPNGKMLGTSLLLAMRTGLCAG